MGGCFSCYSVYNESEQPPPTVKVISVNGDLHEYSPPAFVSQVLQAEASSSSSSSSSCFLCNSDLLSYDDYIPALDAKVQLLPNQIYFVLPKSKLQHRLSASDMAALAVKASVALQNASKKDCHRRKKNRISPVLAFNQTQDKDQDHTIDANVFNKTFQKPQPHRALGFSRSSSVRRLQKYTSRRTKLSVRSFKLRLTTIYEGVVL